MAWFKKKEKQDEFQVAYILGLQHSIVLFDLCEKGKGNFKKSVQYRIKEVEREGF